jgi:hypothetical protein
MHMQVRHGLARVLTVIDHEAETLAAILDAQLVGDFARCEQQSPQCGLIFGNGLTHSRNQLLRHYQDVCRSLWIDVIEGRDQLVLINKRGRDFAVDDFLAD